VPLPGGRSGPNLQPPNVLVNDPAEDGTSVHDTHSETTIAVVGTTVLSAFNDSFYLNANPGQITGLSRSTDRGGSFTDLGRLMTLPGGDAGDPALAHDNVSGRTYLATLSFQNSNTIPVFRSDDEFQTYLPGAVNATPGHSGLMDKEWMVVDNYDGPGQGTVYVIARDFGSGNGIYLSRSTDQGNTFGPSGGVQIVSAGGGNVQGAWVAVGPDHAVYASYYQSDDVGGTNGRILIRKSMDQGQTFGPAVLITRLTVVGVNGDLGLGFRSFNFPQVAVNPVNNQVYLVYHDRGVPGDRADVYFRQSNDGGATWSDAVRVVDDTTNRDQWEPAIAVSPNGSKVGVFWYDRRLDPANNLIDRFGAIGVVSGDTVVFGANFRVTDTSFPPAYGQDPGIVPTYMGDYDQVVADTGSFYLTWGDNRSPSRSHSGNRADVRFARISVDVAGPSVIAVSLHANTFAPVGTMRVTFDEPIDVKTATVDQFAITDSSGNPINVQKVTPVDGSGNQQFDVTFDQQTVAGTYSVAIGPFIADTNGHYMDQDGDGDPTGQKDDGFNGSFSIVGPSVLSTDLSGRLADQVDHGQIVFNTPIDPNSFTFDQFVLTAPDGSIANVTSIMPDDNTNRVFDVTFDVQTRLGNYTLVVGPNITDAFGNPMPAPYRGGFMLSSERIINGGFETGNFMGWTQSGNTGATGVSTATVHSGQYSAYLGPVGSEGFLAQIFPTTAGATYILDYWLQHDGGSPSSFHAMINGVDIPGSVLMNPAAFGYREYTFTFTAAGSQTELKFGFREDPTYFHLDDVSVNPMGAPGGPGRGGQIRAALLEGMRLADTVGVLQQPAADGNPSATAPAEPVQVTLAAAAPTVPVAASEAEAAPAQERIVARIDEFFTLNDGALLENVGIPR
jgi:hypothetical protein